MAERNLGEAAVGQPWLGSFVRSVRSAPRIADDSVATTIVLRALVGSRLIVWVVGIATLSIIGRNGLAVPFNDPNHLTEPFSQAWANFLLAPAARWDSVWYLRIAHLGYFSRVSSAFFPLYPLLIHVGTAMFGSELVVGMLISSVSAVVALYLLYRLALIDLGDQAARTSVLMVALFPTAFFLSAVYTESLFLMLSVGAIYAARRDHWVLASALGALAAASRSNGILIALPLVFMYAYGPRDAQPCASIGSWWRPRYQLSRSSLWLLVVPMGLIAYLGYLWITHDAPLAPFQVQGFWRRGFAGPFGAVIHLAGALPQDLHRIFLGRTLAVEPGDPISWTTHDLIDLGFLAFAAAGLAWSWRRVPLAYFLYALVMLAQALAYPSTAEPLASFGRYLIVIFPLFMGWGAKLTDKPVARRAILVTSAGLLAALSGVWAYWGWVA